ncbi:hypothetical protein CIPAW_03G077900 [Carya illinoinensis]|uniref:Uncharacterized protein n=1 Tax=Carya illinoinensis TaxID=32201 RepID=A0A8T1R013_CARIL|nr:hypothetical protein CIPAW_03G077900 [Carya illinoinensis]
MGISSFQSIPPQISPWNNSLRPSPPISLFLCLYPFHSHSSLHFHSSHGPASSLSHFQNHEFYLYPCAFPCPCLTHVPFPCLGFEDFHGELLLWLWLRCRFLDASRASFHLSLLSDDVLAAASK